MTSANGKALVHNVHLVGRPLFYPKMLLLWRKIDFPNLLSSNSRNLPIKSLFKKIEIFLTWAANNTIGIWWNLVLDSGKNKIWLLFLCSNFNHQNLHFVYFETRQSSDVLVSTPWYWTCTALVKFMHTLHFTTQASLRPLHALRIVKVDFFLFQPVYKILEFKLHQKGLHASKTVHFCSILHRHVHTFEWTFLCTWKM